MENNDLQTYATAIFQNAMVGVQSINDIKDSVADEKLKKELSNELKEFNKIVDELKKFALINNLDLKDNNFFEKSRLWMSIKMSTMFSNSTRHIAEMMLLGTVMGLTTCYKDKVDHKNINTALDSILDKLEKTLDNNYQNLKLFLKEI